MTWFFIALISPFLFAITNHIDKILLEKYFKVAGVGTLILFSSLLSVLALPFLFWADPMALNVGAQNILILAVVGLLNILLLWCYLSALKDEEASVIIVFYQLVPVFGYGLGYLILDEVLSDKQLIAMGIIILGTTIVSFEFDGKINGKIKFRIRGKTIILMLTASFAWALGSVIFKAVALEENVWRALFWEHLMLVVVGLCIFAFMRPTRNQFLNALKTNSTAILSLNLANEILYMLGNLIAAYAYLLAPIALVLLTESFQPIFVFAIAVVLTLFFPRLCAERMEGKYIWQKLAAIAITGIGTFMLLRP